MNPNLFPFHSKLLSLHYGSILAKVSAHNHRELISFRRLILKTFCLTFYSVCMKRLENCESWLNRILRKFERGQVSITRSQSITDPFSLELQFFVGSVTDVFHPVCYRNSSARMSDSFFGALVSVQSSEKLVQ